MNDRRAYLVNQKAMALATPDELQELQSMPVTVRGDGGNFLVCPPRVPGATLDEQALAFVAMGQGRSVEEVRTQIVSGEHDELSAIDVAAPDPEQPARELKFWEKR